jgi:glycosyltransferase involved in cell wall biosynthesis
MDSLPKKVSVIVATYNRAEYLRLCLACLAEQDYAGSWEVFVADDGSTDHTSAVVAEEARRLNVDVRLVWQEDNGFRKARILNQGARQAHGDLLVFLDSDCLPALDLVSSYARHCRTDSYYLGGVYKLSKDFSEPALRVAQQIRTRRLLAEAARSENQLPRQRRGVWMRWVKSRLYVALAVRKPKIWGGNFAVNREVFEAVNGFDENYVGWGQEDSDLRNRLVMGGYHAVCLHTVARSYHLWHLTDWTARVKPDGERGNRRYYKRSNVEVVCQKGQRKL